MATKPKSIPPVPTPEERATAFAKAYRVLVAEHGIQWSVTPVEPITLNGITLQPPQVELVLREVSGWTPPAEVKPDA